MLAGVVEKACLACLAVCIPGAVGLLLWPAPYGRYSKDDKEWRINARLAWVVFELPNLLWVAYGLLFWHSDCLWKLPNLVLLGFFTFHYINRTIIYPLRLTGGKPWPVSQVLGAIVFTSYNGFVQTVGLMLYLVGLSINCHSDSILNKLKSTQSRYQIPRGGLFEYVSGANYFGEIIEWGGYAVASGLSLAPLTFFIFTICVLAPRAINHHKWYHQTFKEYPKSRKALIPFVL